MLYEHNILYRMWKVFSVIKIVVKWLITQQEKYILVALPCSKYHIKGDSNGRTI